MKFESSNVMFNDTIDSLRNEFKNDTSNTVIICGARDFSLIGKPIDYFREKYDGAKIITFNQEPLLSTQKQFMTRNYLQFLKQSDEVWDYDEQNLSIIKNMIPNANLHILKPYKTWPVTSEKDIDILFYGTMNEHRSTLLNELSKRYNVVIANGHFDDLDSYILRSKILLNIHYYYECAMQEQARMIRWIGAPCRIISEKSNKNYLSIEEMTYEELFKL